MLKRLLWQLAVICLAVYVCTELFAAIAGAIRADIASHARHDIGDLFNGLEYFPVYLLYVAVFTPLVMAAVIYLADRLAGYGNLYIQLTPGRLLLSFWNKYQLIALLLVLVSLFLPREMLSVKYVHTSFGQIIGYVAYTLLLAGATGKYLVQKYSRTTMALLIGWTILCVLGGLDWQLAIVPKEAIAYIYACGFVAITTGMMHTNPTSAQKIIITSFIVLFLLVVVHPFFALDASVGKYRYRDKVLAHINAGDRQALHEDIDYLVNKMHGSNIEAPRYILAFTVKTLIEKSDREGIQYICDRVDGIEPLGPVVMQYLCPQLMADTAIVRLALQHRLIAPGQFADSRGFMLNMVPDTTICNMLLQNGADINARDTMQQPQNGFTPLLFALHQHDYDKVYYLLNKGANADVHLNNETYAMSYAIDTTLAASLVRHGAQPHPGMRFQYRDHWNDAMKAFMQAKDFVKP